MTLLEIQIAKEKAAALEALYRDKDTHPWPKYEDNPELFMDRARNFLDAAERIYPRG